MGTLWLGQEPLRIEHLVTVATQPGTLRVRLAPDAVERLQAKRALIDRLGDADRPVYGVTTGFGALAQTPIPRQPGENSSTHSSARTLPGWDRHCPVQSYEP